MYCHLALYTRSYIPEPELMNKLQKFKGIYNELAEPEQFTITACDCKI